MNLRATTTAAPARGAAGSGLSPDVGVARSVIGLAVVGTILLALGAFWLSFTTLRDLAVLSGIPEPQAWVWPLIVDGVILEATISVVALRNSASTARRFAWLLLTAGAGVSVAANITHAVVASHSEVPAIIAALVASVPPLVLLAMTHLTVELTRNTTPAPTPVPNGEPEQVSASLAVVETDEPANDEASALKPPAAITTGPPPVGRGAGRERALELRAEGVSKREIASVLGVHPTTVGRWLNAPDRQQDGDER